MKRRSADILHDLGTARGSLHPAGKRQERALNFIPFLARDGPPLLESMLDEATRHAAALVTAQGESRDHPAAPVRASGRA